VTSTTVNLIWADPVSPRGFDTFPIRVWNKTRYPGSFSPYSSTDPDRYVKNDIANTVHSFSFPPASLETTLTPGHRYNWWMHARDLQNCSGVGSCSTDNGWSLQATGWFCRETASCSPACGQAKDCIGNCAGTDNGSPAQVAIVAPNGSVASPTIFSDVTTVSLFWTTAVALTDDVEALVSGLHHVVKILRR